jgi:ABC-type glutathione transport system ATPase component/ABC-type dipeptide/oligopeptide/nickel transport system permease subunit
MMGSYLNSALFALMAVLFALMVGIILGILHRLPNIYFSAKHLAPIGLVSDFAMLFIEILPGAGMILVVSYFTVDILDNYSRMTILALGGGLIWSCVVGRVVSNRLLFEFEKEYSKQLILAGASPLREIVLTLIFRRHLREIGSAAAIVGVYAVLTDTSLGFMLNFNPELRGAPVRYYSNSFGYYASTLVGQPLLLTANIAGLVLCIVGLIKLTDWLERSGSSVADRIERRADLTSVNNSVLTVPDLRIHIGPSRERGFSLIVNQDTQLNVAPGNLLWLQGPSGSGKSLFFRALVRFLPPSSEADGKIHLSDSILGPQNIEIIFQEPSLYLYPYLRLDALSRLATGESWIDVAGLGASENVKRLYKQTLDSLSAGQKRIAFSSLVFHRLSKSVHSPASSSLVLCDEPDASMDKENTARLTDRLAEILKQKKVGVVYVSHNPEAVQLLASKCECPVEKRVCHSVDRESLIVLAESNPIHIADSAHQSEIQFAQWPEIPSGEEAMRITRLNVSLPGDIDSGFDFCSSRFVFPKKRVIVLYGNNGAGKSTFLKGLSGFYPSTIKELVVEGMELTRSSVFIRRAFIGHMLDDSEKSFPLYAKLEDSLAGVCKYWGTDVGTLLSHLVQFGLPADSLQRYPIELSGGQRQKLSYVIARHIIKSPVVLLDEPFSRLDAEAEEVIIDDLFRDKDRTYLIISHRPELLANRGALGIDIAALL